MAGESLRTPISSIEEARKADAAARARDEQSEMIGWGVVGLGVLGLCGIVFLASEHASPYIWDAFVNPRYHHVGLQAVTVAAYLLSYLLVAGVAFISLYNYYDEQIGIIENLMGSIWILFTVVFFTRPVVHSVMAFVNYFPSKPWGRISFAIWMGSTYFILQIWRLAYTRRNSYRRTKAGVRNSGNAST